MSVGRVLVIGESLIDLIGFEDADGLAFRPRIGGSPLNVAVGVSRLGGEATFATAIAPDSFGVRIRALLDEEGVTTISAPAPDQGTCLAVVTKIGQNVEFEFFGDTAAMLDIGRVSDTEVGDAAVVHAGSTAFMDDPALATVVDAYGRADGFCTADPNPRPLLIPDRARYVERMEPAVAGADLVKLSSEDVAYCYPGLTLESAIERLIGLGPDVVVVTRAADDALVSTAAGQRSVPIGATSAIDPTGAGDTVSASLVADIAREGAPADLDGWAALVRRANEAAAITCSRLGGASAMPTRAELEARLDA